MLIFLNGEKIEIKNDVTIQDMLEHVGHNKNMVAAALNETFVPRSLYCETKLKENDALEFLKPMAGG